MPGNVFLIAATNHEHLLDPAIWRRFNVTITLDLPNIEQRELLMEKWFCDYGMNDVEKMDFKVLAKISDGLNGAQIKELASAAGKKYSNRIQPSGDPLRHPLLFSFSKEYRSARGYFPKRA